jgi:hypothetical protein
VYKREAPDQPYAVAATVDSPGWLDTAAEFGKPYTYMVQNIVPLGENREAESEPTTSNTITPVDTFAPAIPSGLRAEAAPGSIELTWDRNREPDLAGYRVFRAAPGGAFEKVAEPGVPAWSDRKAEPGKRYRYQVSAFDQSGNESVPSAPVEASVQ